MRSRPTVLMLLAALSTCASAQLSTPATANSAQNSNAILEGCRVTPTDQVWQSGLRPEIWYVITQNQYGAGETDIVALNTTSCFPIVFPVADFMTQLPLADECVGSGTTEADNSAGRRLLSSVGQRLQSSTKFQSLATELQASRRSLAQAQAPADSSQGSGSASDILDRLAAGGSGSSASAPAPVQAALNNNCGEKFNNDLMQYQLGQSTLKPAILYFVDDARPDTDVGFCMANVRNCTVACLNATRFWAATNTDIAALCQLAGLV